MKAALRVALLVALSVPVITTHVMGGSVTTDVGGVHVDLRSAPDAPGKDEKTIYTVQLADAVGKTVTDARATLTGRMACGMALRRLELPLCEEVDR